MQRAQVDDLGLDAVGSELVGGLRYVRASTVLPLVLVMEATFSVFGHNQALMTIFARDILGAGAEGLGLELDEHIRNVVAALQESEVAAA